MKTENAERQRLAEDGAGQKKWKRWGPYLSERQWGTVREDYSPHGNAWEYFPHDHARSRAYRWGEDGLAEDVKELYYYLDATPTHSYLKMLYKYPQRAFPYARLVEENGRRGKNLPEFELLDTGVFDDNRYFDVFVEYAKAGPDDILMQVTVYNRGPEAAAIHVLPQLWFRNTWSWKPDARKPKLSASNGNTVEAAHPEFQHQLIAKLDKLRSTNSSLLETKGL